MLNLTIVNGKRFEKNIYNFPSGKFKRVHVANEIEFLERFLQQDIKSRKDNFAFVATFFP